MEKDQGDQGNKIKGSQTTSSITNIGDIAHINTNAEACCGYIGEIEYKYPERFTSEKGHDNCVDIKLGNGKTFYRVPRIAFTLIKEKEGKRARIIENAYGEYHLKKSPLSFNTWLTTEPTGLTYLKELLRLQSSGMQIN